MPAILKNRNIAPVSKQLPARGNGAKSPVALRRAGINEEAAMPIGGENLDKVRDILFGSQMRESDRRFQKMEERLAKDLSDLRDENRKRLDALEALLKKEIQSLGERLKSEQTQRSDADKSLAQDLKSEQSQRAEALKGVSGEIRDAVKSITEQLRAADDKNSEATGELRREIADQSKRLRDEFQQAHTAAQAASQRTTEELRNEKADRSALADLFTEIAVSLSADSSGKKGK